MFTVGLYSSSYAQESFSNALNVFVSLGENNTIAGYYEFPLSQDLTISPEVSVPLDFDYFYAGARVDYYFDTLLTLSEPWDIWGGIGAGLFLGSNVESDVFTNLHIGGEYKFNETWGIILESGFLNGGSGSLGVGIHL